FLVFCPIITGSRLNSVDSRNFANYLQYLNIETTPMNTQLQELSEQEVIRREKLDKLRQAGIDPYPAPAFRVSHHSTEIKNRYQEEEKEQWQDVSVAGRIVSINDKGKVFFIKIQDSKGVFQLYIKRDELYPGEDKSEWDILVKHGLDLGDFVGASGYIFTTRTGEISLH